MVSKTQRRVTILLGLFLFTFMGTTACRAQDSASPKFTFFGGAGSEISGGHAHGAMQLGASIDEAPPGAWGGYLFEGGYIGPWKTGSAIFSANYMAAWALDKKAQNFLPFATVGYSRLFGTGNAINFGAGIDLRFSDTQALRIEVRDYSTFTTPRQNDVALRVGWVIYIAD